MLAMLDAATYGDDKPQWWPHCCISGKVVMHVGKQTIKSWPDNDQSPLPCFKLL